VEAMLPSVRGNSLEMRGRIKNISKEIENIKRN
jgi:hypothetical protein